MKEFLEKLLKKIVSQPEKVKVEEAEGSLLIEVDSEDTGIVIGKEGRAIKALRNLVNLRGAKLGKPRFELKVNVRE